MSKPNTKTLLERITPVVSYTVVVIVVIFMVAMGSNKLGIWSL